MTHRWYDQATGRFVNRDPLGYGGGLNVYGYAGGNPITGSDPSGLDALVFWGTNNAGSTPAERAQWEHDAEDIAQDYDSAHSRHHAMNLVEKAYVIGSTKGLTLTDVQNAFKTHYNIDTIVYVGHAGPEKLYMSSTFNMSALDVNTLSTANVEPHASITLDGCHTGESSTHKGVTGIAHAFADHFNTTVHAYLGGLSFGIPILFGSTKNEIYRFSPDYPRTLGWQYDHHRLSAQPVDVQPFK